MVLLAVIIASIRKSRNAFVKGVVIDLPTFIFIEFVKHLHDTALSIGEVLSFHNFAKDPSSFWMFAINEHIFFDLIIINNSLIIEVLMNKLGEICLQFICI